MIYLYKYIDMNDNITKYVGIVSEKNRELKDRIIEHYKKDVWSHGYFRVEYIELLENRKFIWKLYIVYNNDITVANIKNLVEKTQKLKYMVNKLDKKPSIWQGKNGFWYVYVPDATKKRKMRLVKRKSKESLEKYIRDFYNEFKE